MPETILALILFLCFATPGLTFELLRERSRPAREYTALRETSVIIVASVCFTLPAAALLLALRLFVPQWFPDFNELASNPAQYSASHLPQVIFLILAIVTVAVLLAFITDCLFRFLRPPHASVRKNPAWFEIISGQGRPSNAKAVLASVELKGGGSIQGAVKAYDCGKDQTLSWLILQKHSKIKFAIRTPDGTLTEIPNGWAYVVVPGDQMRSVNIAYSLSQE